MGGDAGPASLHQWWELTLLTVDELRAGLAVVWTGAEVPTDQLGQYYWVQMFRAAGFVSDTGAAAPKSLTVFRGSSWGRRRGMSWTTSIERAREVASSSDGEGDDALVFACNITRSAILAVLGRAGAELEVVVDPEKLPSLGRSAIQS